MVTILVLLYLYVYGKKIGGYKVGVHTHWDGHYVDRLERIFPEAGKVRGDIKLWLIRFRAIVRIRRARIWWTYIFNVALEPLDLLNYFFGSIVQRVKIHVVSFEVYLIIIITTHILYRCTMYSIYKHTHTRIHETLYSTAPCVVFLFAHIFCRESGPSSLFYIPIDCTIIYNI